MPQRFEDQIPNEFRSVNPSDPTERPGGSRSSFEDPGVQAELERLKTGIDRIVENRMAGFDARNPKASPEDRSIAEAGARSQIEMILSLPQDFGEVRPGNQPSRDEHQRHHKELLDVADEVGDIATEQEVEMAPKSTVEESDNLLLSSIEAASKVGIKDESELKQMGVLLGQRDVPRDQRSLLSVLIQRKGYHSTPDELLGIVRNYLKESVKAKENGLLLHYHQTAINNVEGIVREGMLISQDERRARGEEFKSTGARPDVVQMTRDSYDSDGNLLEAGLKDSSDNLIAQGGVAFVFDESVMDEPDYDCTNKYPNLPRISLEGLKAVVVNDEGNMRDVQDTLTKGGIRARVMLRADWLKGYGRTLSQPKK